MDTHPATGAIALAPTDFRAALEDRFENSFVVKDFLYKGLILDYAIIVTDRLIEVAHVATKEEYAAELAMIGRSGPRTFKKHKSIQDSKFVSNAFYFLAPSRILIADEVPPKYGLITYSAAGLLVIKKEADWIDPLKYLAHGFYKTLATKLAKQLYRK